MLRQCWSDGIMSDYMESNMSDHTRSEEQGYAARYTQGIHLKIPWVFPEEIFIGHFPCFPCPVDTLYT